MNFSELLKASKGLPVDDTIAALWGKKIYDANEWQITTLTGTLPLSFLSKGEALTNYLLHGTSEGAGVETKNKFDKAATDTSNGFIANARLRADGTVQSHTGSNVTEYIPITPGTNYYIWPGATLNLFGDEIYDENKVRIRGAEYQSREYLGFTARAGEAYVRFTYWAAQDEKVALYEESNSTVYIPNGYKLPLTITSGAQSQDYPLYIGSTQLGAEEYLDYESGKIYKRTANLFNKDAKDTEKGYVNGYRLRENGTLSSGASFAVSEFIKIEPNTDYYLRWIYVGSTLGYCLYDSGKQYLSGDTYSSYGESAIGGTVTTGNASYIRFTINKAVADSIMLISGSTAPSAYIPYIQPTDPPVPFPAISTYQGENTLSSTETVGEVEITGRIKSII